jgi:hypothetical protein
VSLHDAFQLRGWALTPEDAFSSLEEIASRIVSRGKTPSTPGEGRKRRNSPLSSSSVS